MSLKTKKMKSVEGKIVTDEDLHVHEFAKISIYVRVGNYFKREWRWKCQHPDCHAIWRRYQVRGKRSTCCICHSATLILDNDALKLAKPRCMNCSNSKEAKERRENVDVAREFLDALLDDHKPETKEELEENELLRGMYSDD